MENYEKLGAFYLGREYSLEEKKLQDNLVLYDSKDLVTHAVCVGMTGSGKTGLCVGILEEAVMDGIPAIIIDPKGDLPNLLLTFPDLQPEDFRPCYVPPQAIADPPVADFILGSEALRLLQRYLIRTFVFSTKDC